MLESFDEYDMGEIDRKRDRIVESNYNKTCGPDSSSSISSSSCKSLKGDRSKANVLLKLFGPLGNMRIRSIKKTVWFWGILLGTELTLTPQRQSVLNVNQLIHLLLAKRLYGL